jgi:hypothetical protein
MMMMMMMVMIMIALRTKGLIKIISLENIELDKQHSERPRNDSVGNRGY